MFLILSICFSSGGCRFPPGEMAPGRLDIGISLFILSSTENFPKFTWAWNLQFPLFQQGSSSWIFVNPDLFGISPSLQRGSGLLLAALARQVKRCLKGLLYLPGFPDPVR